MHRGASFRALRRGGDFGIYFASLPTGCASLFTSCYVISERSVISERYLARASHRRSARTDDVALTQAASRASCLVSCPSWQRLSVSHFGAADAQPRFGGLNTERSDHRINYNIQKNRRLIDAEICVSKNRKAVQTVRTVHSILYVQDQAKRYRVTRTRHAHTTQ